MKATDLILNLHQIVEQIGTGVITGGIGGLLSHLHTYTKTGEFKLTKLIVGFMFGAFAGYIVSGFTTSGAISGIAGAFGLKIFDFITIYGDEIIKKTVENKLGVELHEKQSIELNDKKCNI